MTLSVYNLQLFLSIDDTTLMQRFYITQKKGKKKNPKRDFASGFLLNFMKWGKMKK